MKLREKMIGIVCGTVLFEGIVAFLALYLGFGKKVPAGAWITFGIVVLLSLAVGAVLAVVFSSAMSKRIKALKEQLTAMSNHDLSYEMSGKMLSAKDEVGELSRASEALVSSFKEIVSTLKQVVSGMDKNVMETSQRVDTLSEKCTKSKLGQDKWKC